jgi:amyloid beta precursor protein binding protein 1
MTEAAKQGSTDKYDRQLRLWGANGQRALMDANILLVNAGPTGTETLKNLVLPAVGRFTVLDNKIVQQADCAHNFFVTSDHIGKPRAETVTELLVEMNADCSGTSRVADPAAVIASEPDFFKNFTLIIATQVQ